MGDAQPPAENRVAIVTGASSGIGEESARRLAAAGLKVVLAARRRDRLERLRSEIEEDGGSALAIPTDVTDRGATERMALETLAAFKRIDILVNNAGIMPLSPIAKFRVDDWDQMIDVNVKGVLYCIAATLPQMLEQGGGHIINISSVAGRRPLPAGTVYAATKFAVRAISAGLHLELSATHNIRVTDIEPGVVDTELTDHISDTDTASQFKERWGNKTPLAAEDVASAILYAIYQPNHVNVNEILLRPTQQGT